MFSGKKMTPQEVLTLLNCRRLPARLNTSETAAVLGFQEHDISVLVGARMLQPLGNPAPNAPKYFASVEILAHAQDPAWLGKATKALAKYWTTKNSRRGERNAKTALDPDASRELI